jgi:hypothetical protein
VASSGLPFAREQKARLASIDTAFLDKQIDGLLPKCESLAHALLEPEAPDSLAFTSNQVIGDRSGSRHD